MGLQIIHGRQYGSSNSDEICEDEVDPNTKEILAAGATFSSLFALTAGFSDVFAMNLHSNFTTK